MKCFYPGTTNKIIHIGKNGNIYKLDGIEKCISLYKLLKKNKSFLIKNIKVNTTKQIESTEALINKLHSKTILKAYKTGKPNKLANSSGVMWQENLYSFVLESAEVARRAGLEALKSGKAIALVGGGHHAERKTPLGFCTVNTMAIAAITATQQNKKVAIIDLDVHYSNGCFDILQNKPNIHIYSIWNQKLNKWKSFENKGNIWHKKSSKIDDYFLKLKMLIKKVEDFNPDLIIYHLGMDVLESDRMGGIKGMNTTKLISREKIITSYIKKSKTALCIFMGGAYIDWSKGEMFALKQRAKLTSLQEKILEMYNV